MTGLPPLPAEGESQSQVAPGREDRELLHEVRNLQQAVLLLHNIFVKRKVLYRAIAAEVVVVVLLIATLVTLTVIQHRHDSHLTKRLLETCQVRNAQVDATRNYLADTVALQNEAQRLNAKILAGVHVRLSPADQKEYVAIQQRYAATLHRYFVAQPADFPCSKYHSG